MQVLIATGNSGKAREFRQMLADAPFEWTDLSQHPELPAIEETGRTFRANACLKASYYATKLGVWALADDSGLEVDALGGAPGVLSARWAEVHGAGRGDLDNNRLLLQQLGSVPAAQRTARFVCVLALSDPAGHIVLTARDAVEGRIIHEPRGSNGFGYDPLFLIDELGKTTAELEPQDKHRISHRGKALRRMHDLMVRVGLIAGRGEPGSAPAPSGPQH
ncbi:RdgB/HAM1 family non-canonical purine NTP pyrophosphatase [Fontivita pretiosa]|uniref:RdgB/HAM1 family non-canonical purine NTP pyrophosphatase n=1 Tax=Fontivita pretiosa TaxID=2989684 RepID=UPI003D17FF3E